MTQSFKYIASIILGLGMVGSVPVIAETTMSNTVVAQAEDATYARELKALLKKHQQEWDKMIQQQSDAVKSADTDEARAELTSKHREERKEMEARHREEVAALKDEHMG